MAGRGTEERRRKLPGSGGHKLPIRARKLRSRGQKSRDGAPKGAAYRQRCAHIRNGCADRRSIPSLLRGARKGKTVVPAPQNHGRICLLTSPRNAGRGRSAGALAKADRVRGRVLPLTRLAPTGARHPLPVNGEREEHARFRLSASQAIIGPTTTGGNVMLKKTLIVATLAAFA